MRTHHLLSTTLFTLLAACGGGDEPAPGPDGQATRGFTTCGDVTCQPGQYCRDEFLADCRNGCLSDINCTDNQVCDKSGTDVGVCENVSSPPPPPPQTGNEVERCRAKCEDAQACGLFDVATTVECNAACGALSEVQAKALSDCVDNAGCSSSLPGCYNLECGPSYACGAGQECIGGVCL